MYEITKEASVLLHLLRRNFRPDTELLPHSVLETVDWQAVMQESAQQAVLISAFDAAAAYKKYIPAAVYQHWFQRVSRGMMSNLRVNNAQRELISLLEAHGYPYVILKGESAASYYPRPELRHLGDVDFLIEASQKDEIEKIFLAAGYTSELHEHICHIVLKKPGAHLEMHFEIAGIPYGRPGEIVRAYMQDTLFCKKRIGSADTGFYSPDEAHHGLILLLHMQHHMVAEGLGLRHLSDWAAFVDQTREMPFWEARLLPLLKRIGLYKYAAVMTKVCADALGTACPSWAQAEPELCGAILQDILTGGNFGRKDQERRSAGMMISEHGKDGLSHGSIYNLWKTLHQSTPGKFPVVQRIKVLHPVLDAYRAGVYLCRRAAGKRPSLVKMGKFAQERRSVYEQLEIFETEE